MAEQAGVHQAHVSGVQAGKHTEDGGGGNISLGGGIMMSR